MHPQFTTDAAIAEPVAAWVTALPALPGLLLFVAGLWAIRRHLQVPKGLWVVLLLAAVVRLLWIPVGLHEFDGHEADYRDIFLGEKALTRGSTMLYPALQWLYSALGRLSHNTSVLLGVSFLSSLVSIAATYGIGRRIRNEKVGLTAAALLAIWGNHAFWASSAYNVALPLAFGLVAIWALLVLAKEPEKMGAAAVAGGAAVLAVSTRIEILLLAPLGLALLVWARPRLQKREGGVLALCALIGLWSLYAILSAGPLPGGGERTLALQNNLGFLGYWAPFGGWAGLCIFPALWLAWKKDRQLTLILAVFVLLLHLALSSFNDVGFRHTLLASWVLALLLAHLVEVRWGWPILAISTLGLALHTQDVSERYYMSEEHFASILEKAPDFPEDKLSECVLICEDNRVVSGVEQRSHFNLLNPEERANIFAEKGCIYWVFGLQDARWSSRAVRDRALRLEHLFEVRPLGRIVREDGYVGSVMGISPRP
jgi:hypothetical protein